MAERIAKKVLLIGWDAADWKIINPLLDSGKMPALESIVNRGVIGNIATLDPPLSPMLWTSIATGMKADKHGIVSFAEPIPNIGGVRPVNVTSRKVKAIWNILHYKGLRSNVVGWWPSHPAEPINGVMVSNFFQNASNEYGKPWPIPKFAVSPESITRELKSLRVHPGELTQAHVLPFVPLAIKVDQEKDKRLAAIAKITASGASIQSVSTWLMENTEWDFMAVYFDSIDHYCHAFMKLRPPQLKGIPDDLFEIYKDVVDGGYIFQDMMLDRMIKLAGEDTTIIIVSDHGFHSDHLRPVNLPKLPAAPAYEHRPYGIICMAGPNIKKDERIYGASLLDVTPTILSMFGLPLGQDMDGKVLLSAFENPIVPEFIESWEKVEGEFGTHPEHMKEDTFSSVEALKQLVELGYIEDPGEDKNQSMKMVNLEAKYNLSRVYLSSGKLDRALPLLQSLYEENKGDIRFNLDLANCLLQSKLIDEAEIVIQNLRQMDESVKPNVDLLEGVLNSFKNKPKEALKYFIKAEESNPRMPGVHLELGKIYSNLNRYHDGKRAFLKALEIDDGNAGAYHGLSLCHLRLGEYEDAIEHALNSIGLIYHYPMAHYHLGEALYKIGMFLNAAEAFEVVLSMSPKMNRARKWLVKIYSENLNEHQKAKKHDLILKSMQKDKIYIVSGLPRSGTSMMMQILQKGGMNLLFDENRQADQNNPKGYFEFEKVKKLSSDKAWVENATGKVVKVIAQLLNFLPTRYEYKVIFMQRDIQEIMQSQQILLGKDPSVYPVIIAQSFEKELQKVENWHNKEPLVDLMYVNYSEIVSDPEAVISRVNEFLGGQLDEFEAVKAVDPSLYRNKKQ